jgi:hypothetical protein
MRKTVKRSARSILAALAWLVAGQAAAQHTQGWVGEFVLTFESKGQRSPNAQAKKVWGQASLDSKTEWDIRQEMRGALRYTRASTGADMLMAPDANNGSRWTTWYMDEALPGSLTSLVEETHTESWRVFKVDGEAADLRNAPNADRFDRIEHLRTQFVQNEQSVPVRVLGPKLLIDQHGRRAWFQMPGIDFGTLPGGVCRQARALDRPALPGQWDREEPVGEQTKCRGPFTAVRALAGLGRSAVDVVEVPLPPDGQDIVFRREVPIATTPTGRAVLEVRLVREAAFLASATPAPEVVAIPVAVSAYPLIVSVNGTAPQPLVLAPH